MENLYLGATIPNLLSRCTRDGFFILARDLSSCRSRKSHILSFVRCTELLLQDMNQTAGVLNGPVSLRRSTQVAFSDVRTSETTEQHSVVEANSEAAYGLPPHLSLGYLRRLAAAKRDEAEDEIGALREVSLCFQEGLQLCYRENCAIS